MEDLLIVPILKNIKPAEILEMKALVDYAEGQVVSKTLIQNDGLGITLFAFAEGEGISSHESKGDAIVTILDGKGEISIDEVTYTLQTGETIVMPANQPHAVYGVEKFKMLLVVAFPTNK